MSCLPVTLVSSLLGVHLGGVAEPHCDTSHSHLLPTPTGPGDYRLLPKLYGRGCRRWRYLLFCSDGCSPAWSPSGTYQERSGKMVRDNVGNVVTLGKLQKATLSEPTNHKKVAPPLGMAAPGTHTVWSPGIWLDSSPDLNHQSHSLEKSTVRVTDLVCGHSRGVL